MHWVISCNFINSEINRINNLLEKNENINVLFYSKNTKFGKEKFLTNYNNIKNDDIVINNIESRIETIENSWLKQKGNNCRYNAFITLFYFTITPFIKEKKDNNSVLLKELNEKILKLSENITEKNYYDIIIFLQKNKFDSNNKKIDEIINETDENKKEELIKQLKIDDTIDFSSSGYAVQLFSIFNNNLDFFIKENKVTECILCGIKKRGDRGITILVENKIFSKIPKWQNFFKIIFQNDQIFQKFQNKKFWKNFGKL